MSDSCDPMNYSTPGFSVLHYLLESAQIQVHWVGDAIQPSHPLLFPSPPALNLSQQVWGNLRITHHPRGFPGGSVIKNLAVNAGDTGDVSSIPGSGRSPGGGHGNPLQYSCLENPMDRGAWRAIVHRVTKSQTWLSHWVQDSKHIYQTRKDEGMEIYMMGIQWRGWEIL